MPHLAKSAVPTLRLPAPDLFQSEAEHFIAVVKAMAKATDGAIQKQITEAARAADLHAELDTVARLAGPVVRAVGPRAARTLTVGIRALDLYAPTRMNTAEERAELDRATARAKANERTFTLVSRAPVDEWTFGELVRVVDAIRRRMPRVRADGQPLPSLLPGSVALEDRFKDGRRLSRLEVRTWGPLSDQRYELWLTTAAGYVAAVRLPGMFPAAVFAALATSRDRYANLIIELNNRAIAQVGRAQARLQELEALAKIAKAMKGGGR